MLIWAALPGLTVVRLKDKAAEKYRNNDIQNSIISDDPIVRMFAVLDRRIGKRTIEKLNVSKQPEWLQIFYELRKNS